MSRCGCASTRPEWLAARGTNVSLWVEACNKWCMLSIAIVLLVFTPPLEAVAEDQNASQRLSSSTESQLEPRPRPP